eukprot:6719155-Pyramimonas_sp.AAC.1
MDTVCQTVLKSHANAPGCIFKDILHRYPTDISLELKQLSKRASGKYDDIMADVSTNDLEKKASGNAVAAQFKSQ